MATKIVTKNSSTASAVPTASDLVQGELAVNVADKRLFTEDNAGAIVELGTNPTTLNVNGTATMDGLVVQQPSGANILLESTTAGATTGDIFGEIEFKTNDSSSAGVKGKIDSYSEGGVGNGALRLFTGNTTGLYERLRIDSSGNVGINTSSPTHLLQISGGASDGRMSFTNNARGNGQTDGMWVGVDNSQSYLLSRGAYPLNFYTNATERMRIDSSGNVGIGTSLPQGLIDLTVSVAKTATGGATFAQLGKTNESSGYASLQCEVKGGASAADRKWTFQTIEQGVANAGSIVLQPDGGNVGIGNSIPSSFNGNANNLVIGTGSGSEGLTIYGGGESNIFFADGTAGSSAYVGRIEYSHAVDNMLFYVNNANAMTIDSSGNVGIGVSTPSNNHANANNLVVGNGTAGGIANYVGTGTGWYAFSRANANNSDAYDGGISYDGSRNLMFHTNAGIERARIDSSGNLLVGKTTTGVAGAGIVMRGGGELFVTRAGDVMNLNRLSTDGEIMAFRKDGVSVGSISTNANSLPSDRNFKKNIADLTLGLDFVKSLSPKTYNFKIDDEGQAVMAGLIAQEVEESLTAAGVERNSMTLLQHEPTEDVNESDYKMDYVKFVPVLINAMKEQQTLIESLTARIAALEE